MAPLEKSDFIEQIRIMLDMKLEKLENDIKESINELKVKVDDVAIKQSAFSERLSQLESKVSMTEQSRLDQGRRLGDIEKEITTLSVTLDTKERMRDKFSSEKKTIGDWVKWIPGVIIGIIALIWSFFK